MQSTPESRDATTESTDAFFGLLAGLYVAALVVPAVTLGLAVGVTTDAAALFFAVLGTTVGVTAAVGWVARDESLAVRLGSTRWVWLAPIVGFGFGAALMFGSIGGGVGSSASVGVAMLGMLAGAAVGTGLAVAAQNRHVKAVLADAEESARFRARGPERDRRITNWAVVVLMGGGMIGLLVSFATEYGSLQWLFNLLVPLGAGLIGATTERTFAVTDAGLLVAMPVHKRIVSWSAFDSYSVTDDALVLHRAGWSARGLRDVRRDLDEIEDLDGVTAALDEHLPRR
ncbi:hypothetical protein [Halorussus amylolyticus]|uniref:hypothetical protein n=1 Tax=Halorussus amylolyticus TaxID=1126242 RepID=UPI00104663AB|nr:hypothetical protein [Halorussus amylolyticus]